MKETFKLGPDVLLEIVSLVQQALVNFSDCSEKLRAIELVTNEDGQVHLTEQYLANRG
jgi:hypothetical protein